LTVSLGDQYKPDYIQCLLTDRFDCCVFESSVYSRLQGLWEINLIQTTCMVSARLI
jgi:hypothetical protein